MPTTGKTLGGESIRVRDVMTQKPVELPTSATASDAAAAMHNANVGAVIVVKQGSLAGIVTDRDIAVRVVAEGKDPKNTRLEDICSHDLTSLSPDDPVDKAVELMKQRAIRRLPVVGEGSKIVGIISLGDLAQRLDKHSALGVISAAQPNT